MAQDPYGFTPAAPGSTLTGGSASLAMWLGVGAAMLSSVGMCFCYAPYVVAFPMGVAAMWHGSRSMRDAAPGDDTGRSMATAGMVSGLLSALVSGAFLLFVALYLMLYVGIMVIALIGAAAQQ